MADKPDRLRDSESMEGDELEAKERLEKFKTDLSNDADLMEDQRDKANEDTRFINVTGGMWEDFHDDTFSNRAKMEFDLVSNFLYRFLGEWNQNRVGVEFRPDDSATSDEDADLLNGIFRADFRDGSGKMAIDNAVLEAATCGCGDFKLAAVFDDDGDPENETQRIEWRPIHEGFNSTFWDVSAKRIDKRDARWVTVLTEFTKESFEEAWPDISPTSAYTPQGRRWLNSMSGTDGGVFVATRYEVVKKKETVFIYGNLETGKTQAYGEEEHAKIEDELAADGSIKFIRKRKITRQRVEKTVFSGDTILEPTKRIAGKWLPIIRVYAYRAFVDGSEWYHGFVRKMKDAVRLYNVQMNRLAENSLSDGGQKPMFAPEQMPSEIEAHWADKTNKPWLPVEPLYDDNGTLISAGPLGYLPAPQLDGATQALMQVVPEFIREITGGAPQDTMDPKVSGKAIRALVKRVNLHIQPVLENIETAIQWSGEVYRGMAEEIYSHEQMARTLDRDGQEGLTRLQETVFDEETGQLVQANDLRGKKFRVYPDVGPQYDSLREETVENLKGIGDFLKDTEAGQQYIPAIMATLIENMEGVELGPLKELNRRNMILMGLKKPETDEEKQMIAESQQVKPDPQAALIQAAAEQQMAEARNLDASSLEKAASATLKGAQTRKTLADIETNTAKTLAEIRSQVFKSAQRLPLERVN